MYLVESHVHVNAELVAVELLVPQVLLHGLLIMKLLCTPAALSTPMAKTPPFDRAKKFLDENVATVEKLTFPLLSIF